MDKLKVGIDLGTTFSSVAHVDDNGVPKIIKNAEGRIGTPSVVSIRDGIIQVGDIALNEWFADQDHVVRWIKRAMGDPDYRFQGMSAIEISAEILKKLRADAENELARPIDEAFITCPAYFDASEIENTRQAGELAGLNVGRIIKEPTAAAVHYGVEHMKDGETIVVCDLGGGTYDATVLCYKGGEFDPLASMGSRTCGGHDWTTELEKLAADRFLDMTNEDPRHIESSAAQFYEACEKAKRDFAQLPKVTIACPINGKMEQVTITREEFEEETEYLIDRAVKWTEQALAKAELTWQDVNKVLLVGGSSRLRRFGEALKETSSMTPIQVQNPDSSVALGAAILAKGHVKSRTGLVDGKPGGLIEVPVIDRIPRCMGTRVVAFDEHGVACLKNAEIIPMNTQTPTTLSREDFVIMSSGQKTFHLPCVEFEDDHEFSVVKNYLFQCCPDVEKGDPIRVTFEYTVDGILSAEAFDIKRNQALVPETTKYEEPDLDSFGVKAVSKWIVFALDVSGSMLLDDMLGQAKQATIDTAEQAITLGAGNIQAGVVSFGTTARVVCNLTTDLDLLRSKVNEMDTEGFTAMDEGIDKAAELLRSAPAGVGRQIVLVTDGSPNHPDTTEAAANRAKQEGIELAFVALPGAQEDFLKLCGPVFTVTGGENITQAFTDLLGLGGTASSAPGGLVETWGSGFGGATGLTETNG